MIVVTGGIGFIGSNLIKGLNNLGITDILIVDNTLTYEKISTLDNIVFTKIIKPEEFLDLIIHDHMRDIEFVFHIGARTDTTDHRKYPMMKLNYEVSAQIFDQCAIRNVPIIYASSAATYGDGSLGYDDDISPKKLKPLNIYGKSKNWFDKYVLSCEKYECLIPENWWGFKFFNVYGFGEQHKGRMASVVWHGYHQLKETGKLKLFKSHKEGWNDGEQKRDFIYVNDIVDVLLWFYQNKPENGIYNLGTGQARTFNDLGNALVSNLDGDVEYIPMPEDIRDSYQYFTEANMEKLRNIGYNKPFTKLEDGVSEYISKLNQYEI